MKKHGREDAMYAELVDWVSPTEGDLMKMWLLVHE